MNVSKKPTIQARDTDEKPSAPKSNVLIFMMIIAFLDTMGMTIIGPVGPFIVLQHLSDPSKLALVVTWLAVSYSICQMLAAPALGVLSDRFGRRPILFLCLLGSAFGYLLFGLGGSLWVLFLGRIIDGLTGGNFSVIFGYIGDVTETEPEKRGKYFGLFGSLAGIGFMVGPAIGGLLASISYSAPFLIAGAVTLLNLIWGYFFLPESLRTENRATEIHLSELNPLKQMRDVFRLAKLRWILLANFFYAFPFAVLPITLTILIKDSLGWNVTQAGIAGAVVGIVDIIVQGVLVGKLLDIFGDIKLSIGALILVSISYLLLGGIALVASPILLMGGLILFAGSSGLAENALRGMVSHMAGPKEQGRVGGASQSIESLAGILGPLCGGLLYAQWGHFQAYAVNAFIFLLAIAAVLMIRTQR